MGNGPRCRLTPSRSRTPLCQTAGRRLECKIAVQNCGCEQASGVYTAVAEDTKSSIQPLKYTAWLWRELLTFSSPDFSECDFGIDSGT